jgi:FO synthase
MTLDEREALALADETDLARLMAQAARLRDRGHGERITFSRKVFIPLTKLCRDVCSYCTFAERPQRGARAYLAPGEVLAIARSGADAGCREALFTLGDKPELRYRQAAEELDRLGHATTLSYLAAMAKLVLDETGLLPHLNPGVMTLDDVRRLRSVSVSQGLMLETASERLSRRGGPHFGSPDKEPAVRLATIAAAGEADVPFTSGILIGIGETRAERVSSLLALRRLHERHGHLQEIIIQNFRAKSATRMAAAPEPAFAEHLWTIAVARLILGARMSIQTPPNLAAGALESLIAAGINDWGGVSPVTPDHVNPEAPWPAIAALSEATGRAGKVLAERLAIYPPYIRQADRWLDPAVRRATLDAADAEGLARTGQWVPGLAMPLDGLPERRPGLGTGIDAVLDRASAGKDLTEGEIGLLFTARGDAFWRVAAAADRLRSDTIGDTVTYVVNRNINYTNVCSYKCQFCAFSKGRLSENLRGEPYLLEEAEIVRRAREAHERGATEVCLQGGIHPAYTGETYLSILRAIRRELPTIHVHAFSPLEVWQGAVTLGLSLRDYLARLKDEGLGTLPGTAAEILDDEVRRIICPDKVTTAEWLEVMETAHALGLRSTATIMFGHVDEPRHWAAHLVRIRELQKRSRGFTELVPLPFVPMEAPIYLKGRARRGATAREAVLMHAVARLALHPHMRNIQVSWVKMGREGVLACLAAGANDLGGTLMNETISKAAGASHGEELGPREMESLIRAADRTPRQRTTLYGDSSEERRAASLAAAPLQPVVQASARRKRRGAQGLAS